MSVGRLYGTKTNPRVAAVLAASEVLGIKIDLVNTPIFTDEPQPKEFVENFPLRRIPGFIGSDGLVLSETIAIIDYLCEKYPKKGFFGNNIAQEAEVLRWLSFVNSEIIMTAWFAIKPRLVPGPYNKNLNSKQIRDLEAVLSALESHLKHNTYLVGERLTVADLYACTALYGCFKTIFDKEWIKKHPVIFRYFNLIAHNKALVSLFGDFQVLDKALEPKTV